MAGSGKKKRSNIIFAVVIIALAAVIGFSGYKFISIKLNYMRAQNEYDSIRGYTAANTSETDTDSGESSSSYSEEEDTDGDGASSDEDKDDSDNKYFINFTKGFCFCRLCNKKHFLLDKNAKDGACCKTALCSLI